MLRIFRRVRTTLLGQLGTRKYILYALGEVVLIVVGVLLALQLNNWNNYRINRFHEKQILLRLSEELDQSMRRIQTMKRLVGRKVTALATIEPYLNGAPVRDTSQFLTEVILAASFGWEQPKLDHVTFDEIVGSGKLSLLRDTQLRLGLSRFFHTVEQREYRSTARITDFPKITYQIIPRGENETTLQDGLDEKQMENLVNALLQSNLRENLISERNRARFMLNIWESMEKEAEELQEQLKIVRGSGE